MGDKIFWLQLFMVIFAALLAKELLDIFHDSLARWFEKREKAKLAQREVEQDWLDEQEGRNFF